MTNDPSLTGASASTGPIASACSTGRPPAPTVRAKAAQSTICRRPPFPIAHGGEYSARSGGRCECRRRPADGDVSCVATALGPNDDGLVRPSPRLGATASSGGRRMLARRACQRERHGPGGGGAISGAARRPPDRCCTWTRPRAPSDRP